MELYKGKYFEVVFQDWCQEFPGACIVSGHKEKISDMVPEEWMELGELEKELERVCDKLFNPTMYNFACLMNNAYKDNEKPHVHFWFVPRYKDELKLFDKVYKDKHFGYNFWKWANSRFKRQRDIFTQDDRNKMFEMMKNEFNLNKDVSIICPECGSINVKKYLYGEPTHDYDRDKYILGGCEVSLDNPLYKCMDCGKDIFRKKEDMPGYLINDKPFLKREDFMNIYSKEELWSDSLSLMDINNMLITLGNELTKYSYLHDDNFVMDGRRTFLKEQAERLATTDEKYNNKDIVYSFHYMMEFISNDYCDISLSSQEVANMKADELIKKFDKYKETGIICLEEKEAIIEMMGAIHKAAANMLDHV